MSVLEPDMNLVRLAAQRALLFNVGTYMNAISISCEGGWLFMNFYCDRILSEEEEDTLYAVASEITGDIIGLSSSKSTVSVIEAEYIADRKSNFFLVYARA